MWYTLIFVLISCYCYVDAQFMPQFPGCPGSTSYKVNYNCPSANSPFSFPGNIGCSSGCSSFLPVGSRFSFPTFCTSTFSSAKCSSNPSANKGAPAGEPPGTNTCPTSTPTGNKNCSVALCSLPSTTNCSVTECTPCPVVEITTTPPPSVVAPTTTTTAAPTEPVKNVVENVVETVAKVTEEKEIVKKVVDTVKEVTDSTSSCLPCKTKMGCLEVVMPTTTCPPTSAENATTSCELPVQVTCASLTPSNSTDCACKSSELTKSCQSMNPCANQTSDSCISNELTKPTAVNCTAQCENISPNQNRNNLVSSCPNQYVNPPIPCQYPSSNQCFNAYINKCPKIKSSQLFNPCSNQLVDTLPNINPCPTQYLNSCPGRCINDYPKQISNLDQNECWDSYPATYMKCCSNRGVGCQSRYTDPYVYQCQKTNINQFGDPCPEPLIGECIGPYTKIRNGHYRLPCQSSNIYPDQILISDIPCESPMFPQIPCTNPNLRYSRPNEDFLLSKDFVCEDGYPNSMPEICYESPEYFEVAGPYYDSNIYEPCRQPSLDIATNLFY